MKADFVDSYGKGIGIQILQQIETDLFKLGANVSFTKAWVGTDYVNLQTIILRCYLKDLKAVYGTFTARQS